MGAVGICLKSDLGKRELRVLQDSDFACTIASFVVKMMAVHAQRIESPLFQRSPGVHFMLYAKKSQPSALLGWIYLPFQFCVECDLFHHIRCLQTTMTCESQHQSNHSTNSTAFMAWLNPSSQMLLRFSWGKPLSWPAIRSFDERQAV